VEKIHEGNMTDMAQGSSSHNDGLVHKLETKRLAMTRAKTDRLNASECKLEGACRHFGWSRPTKGFLSKYSTIEKL